MNKNAIGAKVKADQVNIITAYEGGADIAELADEYNIRINTLCRKLRGWGVKVRRGDYKEKNVYVPYKRKFSPELLAKMKENTRINNERIQYVSFVRTTEDQDLVSNIINHPIIG